ncbi:hypothetical protein PFLA_a2688 [Pseudoalteromonas flavipulchra NCIMB 2033 = ATCC BAA-314]|nr:hypothetical protein [Pseudoalteromonas flavipulchra NCIMB 2033 = ATCC BAA-314]
MIDQNLISQMVKQALDEDLNYQTPNEGDITAALIPETQQANAYVITREDCVFVGKALIEEVFQQVDPSVSVNVLVNDGDFVIHIGFRHKVTVSNTYPFDIKSQQATHTRSSGFTPQNKSHPVKFREFFSINCTPRQTRVKFGHCRKNEKTTYD